MSDTIRTRAALKAFFETGDVPTQSEFDDLITSVGVRDSATGKIPATELDLSGVVSNIGNVSGTLTPNYSTSSWQAASLTDATTLAVPTNGTAGARLELWLTASGADRDLTLANQIVVPSDSAFVSPKTLTSGKTYIVVLRSPNGSAWWLQSLVGGY
jgi:hypothetical protein